MVQQPPTVMIEASAASVVVGEEFELTWSSSRATSCDASGDWDGDVSTSGTQAFTASTEGLLEYFLTCTGEGGAETAGTTVDVFPDPNSPSSCSPMYEVRTEHSCDGIALLDEEYIQSQSDGIETIEGPSGGHAIRLLAGQSVKLKDSQCTAYGMPGQDFTVSMWFRVQDDEEHVSAMLMGTSSNFGFDDGFVLHTDVRRGKHIVMAFTVVDDELQESGRSEIEADVWHHVALMHDGIRSEFRLMLDGEYFGETWELPGRPVASDFFDADALRLGLPGFDFQRTLDLSDVRSFGRMLSETEVRALYLQQAPLNEPAFSAAMASLSGHYQNTDVLSEENFDQAALDFQQNRGLLWTETDLLVSALNLIDTYEFHQSPLFSTAPHEIPRQADDGEALEDKQARTSLYIHQTVMNTVFTDEVVQACSDELDGRDWKTADRFPGKAPSTPADLERVHTIPVDATKQEPIGWPVAFTKYPSRRPTGLYLPPGAVGTVTVPPALVDQGYTILVGGSTRVREGEPEETRNHRRLPNVARRYRIISEETRIANPVGGGIYIEVPYLADAGLVQVSVTGVIEAPFYSKRSFDRMEETDWQGRSNAPGPWATFVTDKYLMDLPRDWVYAKPDVEEVLDNFDKQMDGFSELLGYLPSERNDVVLYMAPDVWIRHGGGGIGYPQTNFRYDIDEEYFGNRDTGLSFLTGLPDDLELHELGHTHGISMFRGELEAIVNFPYVYVQNVKFGMDFDEAFLRSIGYVPEGDGGYTVDESAVHWMITENFRNGAEMSTKEEQDEFQYQHRGYAKYADIARLFGWDALRDFYRQQNLDIEGGIDRNPAGLDPTDNRIRLLSVAAGVDLTPLIHFWGIHPVDPSALRTAIAGEGLPASEDIKLLLLRYRDLIPADNAAFNQHYQDIWPSQPEGGNPVYGYGWYNAWKDVWDESHAEATRQSLDNIIALYFD